MLGKFITFEGCEGSGKTTQINNLYEYLMSKDIPVIKTREPGGTESAEILREIILNNDIKINKKTELLLHFAARNEHVEDVIKPALEKGKWVLCDRFTDSTIAYQGYGHNLGLEIINNINKIILNNFSPDYTFFMDIDPKISLERAKKRNNATDRYEILDMEFHNKVYSGFKELSKLYPNRIKVINANQNINDIKIEIIKLIQY